MKNKKFRDVLVRLAKSLALPPAGMSMGEAWDSIGQAVNRSSDAVRRWKYDSPNQLELKDQIALGRLGYRKAGLGEEWLKELHAACNGTGFGSDKREFLKKIMGHNHDSNYIERDTDSICLKALRKSNGNITIRGSGKTGKTSLLNRLRHILNKQDDKVVVFLDFLAFEQASRISFEIFLSSFCTKVAEQLKVKVNVSKFWKDKLGSIEGKCENFFESHIFNSLQEQQNLVLFIDAGDVILEDDFTEDFFSLMRAWINSGHYEHSIWSRLFLVIAISTEPYLLIDNINKSPFNVGLVRKLTDFSLEEVKQFNQIKDMPFSESELEKLYSLTSGHPLLIHNAFKEIIDFDKSPKTFFFEVLEPNGPFGAHLRHIKRLLLKEPALAVSLREIAKSKRCSTPAHIFRLEGAGLIKEESGRVISIRCPLYIDYLGLMK